MAPALLARVLLDSPLPQLDRLFDYRVPEQLAGDAAVGVRVRAPLRSAGRIADGYIVALEAEAGAEGADAGEPGGYRGALSELDSIVSPVPVLQPEVYELARRAADRAAGTVSDLVRLAVPKRQVRVEKAWLACEPGDPEPAERPAASPALFAQPVDGYPAEAIDELLAGGGRAAMEAIPRVAEVAGEWVGQWAVTMAALARRALPRGSVILCVPDYRDQEQLEHALRAVLPADRVVRLDARQSNPDRYRSFLACLDGTPRVIVGNRSVVYAPAARLALLALWDDADPLQAEPLAPYVHARDAALLRQEQQGCALVLLGHARGVATERLVAMGWLRELAPLRAYRPKIVPTAHQESGDRLAAQARIPSSAWREATAALARGPVLIQVARPGYAPQLECERCGEPARCTRCHGPLGLREAGATPACRLCGAIPAPLACQKCSGRRFRARGQGATRTAEDLGRAFPGVPVVIADGERQILRVEARPALVIATRGAEPVAAGGYRAVLLLDGERMLAREALTVAEDCLRAWANASALAAPGQPVLLVGVSGELATDLATWRLAGFARRELADRRRLRFPPAVRVATVTGDSASLQAALEAVSLLPGVDALGPVELERGLLRAIVRFDYARGAEVSGALRAELVRNATNRRKRVPPGTGPPRLPTLRVRFDDPAPFDQLQEG
jgi:primosomal protein N' (replication factor Y)